MGIASALVNIYPHLVQTALFDYALDFEEQEKWTLAEQLGVVLLHFAVKSGNKDAEIVMLMFVGRIYMMMGQQQESNEMLSAALRLIRVIHGDTDERVALLLTVMYSLLLN